jgi:hypothetical protein
MALVVAIFAVYFPAWQGGMQWDDESLSRPELRSLAGLWRIGSNSALPNNIILCFTAHSGPVSTLGRAVIGYHLVNLAQHAFDALLLQILRRLNPGALLASAIFAFHRCMWNRWLDDGTENTLSTVFYLAAVLVYLHFDAAPEKLYLYAFLLFVWPADKNVVATLPAALLVIFGTSAAGYPGVKTFCRSSLGSSLALQQPVCSMGGRQFIGARRLVQNSLLGVAYWPLA